MISIHLPKSMKIHAIIVFMAIIIAGWFNAYQSVAQCSSCTQTITSNSNATISTANAVVCITGSFTYSRTITINANNVTLCIGSGVTFSSSGSVAFNGTNPTINNYGTWQESLTANASRTFNNYGTWTSSISMSGGTFNNEPNGTFSGSVTYNSGTINNEGNYSYSSDITLSSGFTFNNLGTGRVTNSGNSVVMNSGSTFNNQGYFQVGNDFTASTIPSIGVFNNSDSLIISDDFTVTGNTCVNSGLISCANFFLNSGSFNNSGTLSASSSSDITTTLTSSGTLIFNSGFTIKSGATLTSSAGATIGGSLSISGTLNAGGTWNCGGAVTVNSGGVLNGGTNTSSCNAICGTSITNNGTMGSNASFGTIVLCRTVTGGTIGSRVVQPAGSNSPSNLSVTHWGGGIISGSFTAASSTNPAPGGYVVLRRFGSAVDATAGDLNGSLSEGQLVKNSQVVALLNGRTNTTFADDISEVNGACGTYHYAVFPTNNPFGNTNNCVAINSSSTPARSNLTVNYVGDVTNFTGGNIACSNSSVVYSVSSTNATSYAWLLIPSSSGTISGSGSSRTINWAPSFTGQATISITSGGCSGSFKIGTFGVNIVSSTTVSTQPPANLIVCSGNAATISITVSGPNPGYLWQSKSPTGVWTNIANTGIYSNATTASLGISNVTGLDGFAFRCQVASSCGNPVSNACTLGVKTAGTWIGASSTDWNNAANWCGGVPGASSNIIVDGSETNNLELNSDITIGDITIKGAGTVIVKTGRIINITGNLVFETLGDDNSGNFFAEPNTTVRFNRAGAQTLSGVATFHNVEFASSGQKQINGTLVVNGGMTVSGTASLFTQTGSLALPLASGLPTGNYGSVSFSGSGVANLSGNAIIESVMQLASGQSLNLNGNRLRINGSISGSGQLRGSVSSGITLAGSQNHTLNFESGFQTLDSLILQKASGNTTIGSNLTVRIVRLINGNLNTGSNTLTLLGTGSLLESAGAMVIGNVASSRTLTAGANNTFGNLGVSIQANGASPGATTVTRFTGTVYTGSGGNVSIARKYAISPTVNAGLNATLVFNYQDSELGSLNEPDLILFRSTDGGTSWEGGKFIPSARDLVNNTLTVTGINSFSDWTAADQDLPLPITLLNFSVSRADNQKAQANWQTGSEINLSHFELQVSRDGGKSFAFVGRTEPKTDVKAGVKSYNLIISDPLLGGLYRLASVDNDGKVQYSAAVKLLWGAQEEIGWGVFPNPAKEFTQVQINAHTSGQLEVEVTDLLGKQFTGYSKNIEQGSHLIRLETNKITSGVYLIRLKWNSQPIGDKKLVVE